MTAGLILLCDVWEYTDAYNDSGGHTPSGTVVFQSVQMRMANPRNSLEMNIQGYETAKNMSAILNDRPGMNLVEGKHYLRVTSPPNHRYYQKMFRVISVSEANVHPADPRRYIYVNLERSDRMHSENGQ